MGCDILLQTELKIPNCVLQDTRLNYACKLVLAEIHYLDKETPTRGCSAGTKSIAEFLGVSEWVVTAAIQSLIKRNYISCTGTNQERIFYSHLDNKPGFVYFAERDGYVKIGCTSKEPSKRISSLKSSHPADGKVILLHAIKTENMFKTEKDFHSRFQDKRINGEWFLLTKENIEMIKEIKEDYRG